MIQIKKTCFKSFKEKEMIKIAVQAIEGVYKNKLDIQNYNSKKTDYYAYKN